MGIEKGLYCLTESDERFCCKDHWCFNPHAGKVTKQRWVKGKRLALAWVDGQQRVFVLVGVRPGRRKPPTSVRWMDAVTGSFYSVDSLRCLTNQKLLMEGLEETPRAATVLLELKVDTGVGYAGERFDCGSGCEFDDDE